MDTLKLETRIEKFQLVKGINIFQWAAPNQNKNLPSVAELSPPENDKCEAKTDQEEMLETRQSMIDNLREDINSKAYKSVIPPSKSVIKMINRFYRKLEESVWRMSTLGCIE